MQVDKTYSLKDLIDHMTSRGSTITKAEGLSVLEEFFHAVENVCRNGNSVNTSLFIIKPGIAGGLPKFDEADPLQGVFSLTRITELL